MARAMGTNAYGKEPRRGERTLSRGFTHRRARRACLRPYGAGASLGRSHRAYALGYFLVPLTGASNRARTRLARREELGIKAQTRVENVETPVAGESAQCRLLCSAKRSLAQPEQARAFFHWTFSPPLGIVCWMAPSTHQA